MDSWIASFTSLPNAHAALVHFPLAVLPLATGFDLACLLRRRAWLDRVATLLWTLGALVAWAALAAGERAADGLRDVPPRVQPAIAEHSDWAHWTLYVFAVVAALRLALWWKDRAGGPSRPLLRGLAAVAGVGGLGLLFLTAEHGGALVYEHGLGVRAVVRSVAGADPAEAPPSEPAAGPTVPERTSDGSVVWRPGSADGGAVGVVLRPASGYSADAVRSVTAGADGLTLEVSGRTLLVLSGTFADVQVEAELAIETFTGTIGVAHHVDGVAGGLFTLGTDGAATLIDRRADEDSILDRATRSMPKGTWKLAVSASGSHLKGLVDGETITHGHIAADPPGACGLWLDGEGAVRLVALIVVPLDHG